MRRSEAYRALTGWLNEARDVALVCHVSPDGDTLGSALALKLALEKLRKRVRVVCQDVAPAMYLALPGAMEIVPAQAYDEYPDIVLFLDISSPERAGTARALMSRARRSACVDHHARAERFAQLTLADTGAAATGVLVFQLIRLLGVALDYQIALCLYTAVATDTGNFAFSNTDPRAFRLAAKCVALELPVAELTMRYFTERTPAGIALLGRALCALTYYDGGAIAVMRLTEADFAASGATKDDEEGFINIALAVKGVAVAVYMRVRGDEVKCSLRSRASVDVARAAKELGGGGHAQAAGVTLDMSMEEALSRVLAKLRQQMRTGE